MVMENTKYDMMFCEIVFDDEDEGDDDEDMTSDVAAAAELTDDQGTHLH